MSSGQVSGATIVIALTLIFLFKKFLPGNKWAFKVALLALLMTGLNMTTGWFGRTLAWASTASLGTTSTVTTNAFGVAVPAVLGITAAFVVGWALWPKHTVTWSSGKGIQSGMAAAVSALMLPLWMTSISGPAGGLVRCAVTQADGATAGVIGGTFGTGSINGLLGRPCVSVPGDVTPQRPAPAPAPGAPGGPQAEGGR